MTPQAGFGDKAGEHLRMARGSYNALPHVVFGFFIVAVGTWLILLLAGFLVLEPPWSEPIFAERRQRDLAGMTYAGVSGLAASLLAWRVFRDRWRCIEAFASRYCSGVVNLSIAYVPLIAAGYALVRGWRKLRGRERLSVEVPLAHGEMAVGTTDLIDAIETGLRRAGQPAPGPGQAWLVAFLSVLALAGIGLFIFVRARPGTANAAAEGAKAACPAGSAYCALPLGLSVPAALQQLGLAVRLEPARVEVAPEDFHLNVRGTITHEEAGSELEALVLGVRVIDASGAELGILRIEARKAFEPPLRSGDSAPFFERGLIAGMPARAELVVLERQTVPGATMPEDDPPLAIVLPESSSKRFVLTALLRHRKAEKLGLGTSTRATIAIRNDGEGVVRRLEVELVPRGGTGRDLGPSRPMTVAYGHMPPMYPGEQRVIRFAYSVAGDVLEERLVVTSVE